MKTWLSCSACRWPPSGGGDHSANSPTSSSGGMSGSELRTWRPLWRHGSGGRGRRDDPPTRRRLARLLRRQLRWATAAAGRLPGRMVGVRRTLPLDRPERRDELYRLRPLRRQVQRLRPRQEEGPAPAARTADIASMRLLRLRGLRGRRCRAVLLGPEREAGVVVLAGEAGDLPRRAGGALEEGLRPNLLVIRSPWPANGPPSARWVGRLR